MPKKTKVWIIAASILCLIGVGVVVLSACAADFNFDKFDTSNYETNTIEINEVFQSISINSDTSDIVFVKSDDGNCRVVCVEREKESHTVSVENGVLNITLQDERKWYDYINIGFNTPSITLYLPESYYNNLTIKEDTGDINIPKEFKFEAIDITLSTGEVTFSASVEGLGKIKASTGDITLRDLSVGDLDISLSTGKVSITNVQSGSLTSTGSTGDLELTNVTVTNKLSVNRSTGDVKLERCDAGELSIKTDTGDVKLERCDAGELSIKTDTGDVKGSLLSDKIFIVDTDTGRKDVPHTTNGGICEITTDTGDIKIEITK